MAEVVSKSETFEGYPIIQRKPFADHLTNFLNTKSEEGYVLNLNAEWGAGKTTFLKCWYNELKKNHPVVYFDAWKSDFTHDAMTALIDCLHDQLVNPISENKEVIRKFFDNGKHFVKKALPSIITGYLKHKTGIPDDESLLEDINETFGLEISEKDECDAIKDVLKEVLVQRKRVNGIEDFKKSIQEVADAYIKVSAQSESAKSYPIYVLIDELDRCRPSYSIEVIECIKHFFNTKNFIFVLATDTEQLQHSIKAIYGSGFEAKLYLSRFFDKTVTLPAPSLDAYLKMELGPIVKDDYGLTDEIISCLKKIFQWHDILSLREIKKVISDIEQTKLCCNYKFNLMSLTILSILKRYYPERYSLFTCQKIIPYRGLPSEHKTGNNNLILGNDSISTQCIGPFSYKIENLSYYFIDYIYSTTINCHEAASESKPNVAASYIIGRSNINSKSPLASSDMYKNILDLAGHFE